MHSISQPNKRWKRGPKRWCDHLGSLLVTSQHGQEGKHRTVINENRVKKRCGYHSNKCLYYTCSIHLQWGFEHHYSQWQKLSHTRILPACSRGYTNQRGTVIHEWITEGDVISLNDDKTSKNQPNNTEIKLLIIYISTMSVDHFNFLLNCMHLNKKVSPRKKS